MAIKIERLHKIFTEHFGHPFLQDGVVQSFVENGRWKLRIGRRDIEIDAEGKFLGSGTFMLGDEDPFRSSG